MFNVADVFRALLRKYGAAHLRRVRDQRAAARDAERIRRHDLVHHRRPMAVARRCRKLDTWIAANKPFGTRTRTLQQWINAAREDDDDDALQLLEDEHDLFCYTEKQVVSGISFRRARQALARVASEHAALQRARQLAVSRRDALDEWLRTEQPLGKAYISVAALEVLPFRIYSRDLSLFLSPALPGCLGSTGEVSLEQAKRACERRSAALQRLDALQQWLRDERPFGEWGLSATSLLESNGCAKDRILRELLSDEPDLPSGCGSASRTPPSPHTAGAPDCSPARVRVFRLLGHLLCLPVSGMLPLDCAKQACATLHARAGNSLSSK